MKIEDNDDRVVEGSDGVRQVAYGYFISLFSSYGLVGEVMALVGIRECILNEMNDSLAHLLTSDDIYTALRSMSPLKAPGLDGLGAGFYKKILAHRG